MSKVKKTELGKGIRALLTNIESKQDQKKEVKTSTSRESNKSSSSDIGLIKIEYIEANPFQPRKEFDEVELAHLAESIKTFGIIQPITLRKLSENQYQIISGERRWRASKMAELTTIPAYIRTANDQTILEMALIENIQREDLNAIEIAISYQRLLDECDLTHEQLSERIGKKRSSISNHLRLLKLPTAAQKAVKDNFITLGHAKLLAGIEKPELKLIVLDKIIRNSLSVRATEKEINKYQHADMNTIQEIPKATVSNQELLPIKDRLSDLFGVKVELKRSGKGSGYLKIPFKSDDEFNALYELLTKQ